LTARDRPRSWRSPSPPKRAWRNVWRDGATRRSCGETSNPGGRRSLKAPKGAAEIAAEADREAASELDDTVGGAATGPAVNRQILASSAYAALRRVTIADPPQAVANRSSHAWHPVSSSHRRATHSRSLSSPLAEGGGSTRLASRSRVWTPRSYGRRRSNASTSAACVHKAQQRPVAGIHGAKPVDCSSGTRGA